MVAPIKFLSGRQQQQKIGLEGSTEEKKVLEVVGRVGIGTTIFEPTSELDIRGSVVISDSITVTNPDTSIDVSGDLDVDGQTEVDDLNVSGIATISTLGVTGLTTTNTLQVIGVSTFNDDIYIGNNISIDENVGVITSAQFSTGSDGIGINTDTISGPALFYLDPATVGDNTGSVRVKGNLYVDGTQFIVNSQTVDLADYRIGIGTTATSSQVLDGAGIGIGSDGDQKTFTWDYNNTALKSSENINVADGKTYQIDGTERLSSTKLTLGDKIEITNSSDDLIIEVDDEEKVRLTDGNLGIGTTAPSARLHVIGSTELENVNISGITTFSDNQKFVGQYSADLHENDFVDIKVSAATKTEDHRYYNSGYNLGFLFDGKESPYINLVPGKTYRFDQQDASNTQHTLRFYFDAEKTTEYDTDVTVNGVAGSINAFTEIKVTDNTPSVLYYQSSGSIGTYMGNRVNVINSFTHIGNNIGIGTTNPSQLLDVVGQSRFDLVNVTDKLGVSTESPLQSFQVGVADTHNKVSVITSEGDVGIGTTNPDSNLHVVGQSHLDSLHVTGITTFSEDIRIVLPTDGSRIGIGTSAFTPSTDHDIEIRGRVIINDGSLVVNGNDITDAVNSQDGNFVSLATTNFYVTGISTFTENSTIDIKNGIGITGGDVSIGTGGTGIYYDDSNSRVGIGTTSPNYKLDVYGDANVSGYTSTRYLTVGTGSTEYTLPAYDGTANSYLRSDGNGNVDWVVTTAIRQTQEFYAGAGQTSFEVDYTPGLIDVYLNGVKLANADYVGTSGTHVVLNVGAGYTDNVQVVHFSSDTVSSRSIIDYWVLNETGTLYNLNENIGIGVTDATQKLDVNGDVRIRGGIYDVANSSGSTNEVLLSDGNGGWVWSSVPTVGVATAAGNPGNIQFHNAAGVNGGSDEFNYDYTTQRIGIGTTEPDQKLDVRGNVVVQGGSIGIGTTNPESAVHTSNTSVLHSGIVTANSYYGSAVGLSSIPTSQLVGIVSTTNLSGTYNINITGSIEGSTEVIGVGTVTADYNLNVGAGNTGLFADNNGDLRVTGVSTLATLKIGNSTIGITDVKDEDTMSSNSDTSLATQQSIKSYVDSVNLEVVGDDANALSIILDTETLGIVGTSNQVETTGSGNNITVGLSTNVSIDGTLTANTGIANSMSSSNTVTGVGQTTDPITLHTLDSSVYRSVEYTVQVVQESELQLTKILAISSGTTAYSVEYGTVISNTPITEYTVDIGGGFIRLLSQAGAATTANYLINFTANKI